MNYSDYFSWRYSNEKETSAFQLVKHIINKDGNPVNPVEDGIFSTFEYERPFEWFINILDPPSKILEFLNFHYESYIGNKFDFIDCVRYGMSCFDWITKGFQMDNTFILIRDEKVAEWIEEKRKELVTEENQQPIKTKTKISHQKQMALVDRLGIIDTLDKLGLNTKEKAKIISLLINKDEQNTREYLTYREKEPDITDKKKFFYNTVKNIEFIGTLFN